MTTRKERKSAVLHKTEPLTVDSFWKLQNVKLARSQTGPSLISLTASVDVNHHVYLLTNRIFTILSIFCQADWRTRKKKYQGSPRSIWNSFPFACFSFHGVSQMTKKKKRNLLHAKDPQKEKVTLKKSVPILKSCLLP